MSRKRKLRLPLAALLGVAVAVLPAVASSETSPTISAVNTGAYSHYWSPSTATVAAGGAVTISNPTNVAHGVEWIGSGPTPTCSGVPVGNSPAASGKEWSGSCTFSQAGTYTFYCTVHGPEMTGTITVNPNGTTTTTFSTPGSPTPTTTTPSKTTTTPQPSNGPLLKNLVLHPVQHGHSVKGSLKVTQAGAGDSLEIDLFAQKASLARTGHSAPVRVGRLVRKSVTAGNLTFAVTLTARARAALARHRRLALTVKFKLTPFYGEPFTLTRTVTQR